MKRHSKQRQQHDLLHFLQSHFVPASRRLDSARGADDVAILNHSRFGVFEVFWWLHLGVEIGVFAEEDASKVVLEIYKLTKDSNEFLKDPRTEQIVSRQLWLSLERTRRRVDVFSSIDYERFKDPPSLNRFFQTALMVSSQLATDTIANAFLAHVTFGQHQEWDALKLQDTSNSAVATLLDSGIDTQNVFGKGTACGGFLKAMEHMARLQHFCREIREDSVLDSLDRGRFERRIRMLSRWRANFELREVEERFGDAADWVLQGLIEEMDSEGLSTTNSPTTVRNKFVDLVTSLIDDWMSGVGWSSAQLSDRLKVKLRTMRGSH